MFTLLAVAVAFAGGVYSGWRNANKITEAVAKYRGA